MKFIEYIEERIKDEEEFDAIISGVDMPATFGFCDDWVITDYCKEKYKDLLNSEIEIHSDPTGYCTDSIEVFYYDEAVGKEFCYAVAGYVGCNEWDRLFSQEGDK